MGRLDFIRGVPGKIREFGIDSTFRLKQFAQDGPALRSIAGDLSKEIVLKTVPGAKWLWKFVPKTPSSGSSSGWPKTPSSGSSSFAQDGPALRSIAGDLSKEIVLKTVPGAKWLWKFVPKTPSSGSSSGELNEIRERITRLESKNSRWKEMRGRISRLESENSSLKEMRERVSRLESENSSLKDMRERASRLESENPSVKEMSESVSMLESENSSLKEMRERVSRIESENSSLKDMRERISLLECEISSVREEKKEWRQEHIMLMASMVALATNTETKSGKTQALLLTMSHLLLPFDHSFFTAEAKKP